VAWLGTRERQFWFLQTLGWSTFFIAAWVGALAAEKPVSYNQLIIVAALSGFLLSLMLRYVYRVLWKRSLTVFITSAVGLSYLLGLGWSVTKNLVYWKVYKPEYWPDGLMSYFSGAFGSTYVFLCWSGLYFGIKYYQMLQDQRRKTLRANALAHEAQLKMLQYQLNPHFLFNTLNAISTLILERDNETANRAVSRLSDFLRYTLHNDPMEKVTLEQELKSLHLYLDIEKVRFQDRLQVDVDVEDAARKGRVPSLVTQPIIENAIKYAVAPREEGGHIAITANVVQDRLVIELADDGPGIESEQPKPAAGHGVGLRNTGERLRQIYGDEYSLELTKARPSGLRVIIGIPYET